MRKFSDIVTQRGSWVREDYSSIFLRFVNYLSILSDQEVDVVVDKIPQGPEQIRFVRRFVRERNL